MALALWRWRPRDCWLLLCLLQRGAPAHPAALPARTFRVHLILQLAAGHARCETLGDIFVAACRHNREHVGCGDRGRGGRPPAGGASGRGRGAAAGLARAGGGQGGGLQSNQTKSKRRPHRRRRAGWRLAGPPSPGTKQRAWPPRRAQETIAAAVGRPVRPAGWQPWPLSPRAWPAASRPAGPAMGCAPRVSRRLWRLRAPVTAGAAGSRSRASPLLAPPLRTTCARKSQGTLQRAFMALMVSLSWPPGNGMAVPLKARYTLSRAVVFCAATP